MPTLVLGPEEFRQIVGRVGLNEIVDDLVERLESALCHYDSSQSCVPARAGFNYTLPGVGLVEWMPMFQRGENVTLKVVGYHPENPARSALPSVLSTISRYDVETGQLKALVDGTFPTVLRTAAASGVASRLLADPSAQTLGIIGCGAQAVSQAHVLSRLFPLTELLYLDTDLDAQNSFEYRLQSVLPNNLSIKTGSLSDIVAHSDILCTATSIDVGEGPLFSNLAHKPHLHINAVGSDFPGKIELPLELLERAMVCPDFLEQAEHEGECQQLERAQIGADLASLLANSKASNQWQKRLTVFDSTGYALEDDVVMTLFLELAERCQVGREIAIESYSIDPKDPYQFLHIAS